MRFSPSFLDRIRESRRLSEVIGRRIAVKKHGREFQALCPFHQEKSPSFTINDDKGFYHCFGCGAHGDAIEFLKRHDRLGYVEAVEQLAREAGIAIPIESPEARQKYEAEKTLYDVCDATCTWFEQNLAGQAGAPARAYAEQRGISQETITRFRIGLAPEARQGLHQHLTKLGFSLALQVEAGVVIQAENGPPYDRFRARLMFPIKNLSGKVVAFGGRLMAPSPHAPKYLNSSETPVFKKGEMLFNYEQAKRAARPTGSIVVMEGYMDAIITAQSGIGNVVASLGTALTAEHLRLLWQVAAEPVLCFDGDNAGARAMLRAAELALPLLSPGQSLRFITLPKGEDPDSFIRANGAKAFMDLMQRSKLLSHLLWETLSQRYRLDQAEGRAALEHALDQLGKRIEHRMVQQHYRQFFREQLYARNRKTPNKLRSPEVEHMLAHQPERLTDKAAEGLLKTVLHLPQLLALSHVEEAISHLSFHDATLARLRDALLAHSHLEPLTPEACRALARELLGDAKTQGILFELGRLPYVDALREEDALLLWDEALAAYHLAQLKGELTLLEARLAEAPDELSLSRLMELKGQLYAAQRTLSRAEPDSL